MSLQNVGRFEIIKKKQTYEYLSAKDISRMVRCYQYGIITS